MAVSTFSILDHLDKIEIVKETFTEYHCLCPVCGDGGFKIHKETGKYKPFKCGCDSRDVREAIKPWEDARKNLRQARSLKQEKPKVKVALAVLPSLPDDIPQAVESEIPRWLVKQGVPASATETKYWYSENQWVSRFGWIDETKEKGTDKTFRQAHLLPDGKTKWNKGSQRWSAYKLSEAIAHCRDKWVIGTEGEKWCDSLLLGASSN